MKQIAYLNLQLSVEGQASYAHVHEIISGLHARSFKVELFEPSKNTGKRVLAKLVGALGAQMRLVNAIGKYDAVYIRSHTLAFFAAAVLRAYGVPVIQENNGPYDDMYIAYPWTKRLSFFLEKITDMQFGWAGAVITVTSQLAKWLGHRTGREDIHVIPNGANTGLFQPAARSSRELPERYVFFFGALAAWQGIGCLLAAVTDPLWPAGVKLVVAGDGAETKAVQDFASKDDRVVYLGKVPYACVPGILAGSLAGLSPQCNLSARAETGLSPLKVFETMACGVPVILSDFPGVADVVRASGAGIVVPPADPKALAAAIALLAGDENLRRRMGDNGRRIVELEHSWDSRAGATAGVINSVLSGASPVAGNVVC